ncbi:sulfurtransferase [Candidatus Aquiluna sp. UB-MaderosW2red]|jgi:thiosulfate/3-mercaptopyruvate sulfurtransferase|uniref:sulfurtransferase n=1 Tax=Candidatus Aquiluna sp. UB-MaderosW2red TaxID=1855377 RepID=UPI000875EC26|nr:sulfurtransferase [Candidatus Aquiluna sp. UB-MaderosW2red]SCX11287.1 thiosulfate/3-mercaptopyruvate sulfurtransferase [Candidatus Aquiluna sp. UB-MaderosW2red]
MSQNERIAQYAHPEVVVTDSWLFENLASVKVVECDEDILLYETGHIPTAVKLDWHTELNHPASRDYLDGEAFAKLMNEKGISRDDTVVLYGDKSNWWATYAFWVFKLFGHQDVRMLDGGRAKWISAGRELTKDAPAASSGQYPIVERDDSTIRAFREEVLEKLGAPLIDVRSFPEYTGERLHMPDYPNEGASRGGHIPTAASIPWSKAIQEDETFRTLAELEEIYFKNTGFDRDSDFIAYCRIGERSSHSWFVLKYLLGVKNVKNYDGSWTEWGNLVGVPIAVGEEPGVAR